jgi:hypothetical protein
LSCTSATLSTESLRYLAVCTAMHSLSGSGQGRKSESVDGVRQRRGA